MQAQINGAALFSVNNPITATNSYLTGTGLFTASSASTNLLITGTAGGHYVGLDNVKVLDLGGPAVSAAVPEPATWAMMVGGFGAIGFAMRRRRKTSTTVRFA